MSHTVTRAEAEGLATCAAEALTCLEEWLAPSDRCGRQVANVYHLRDELIAWGTALGMDCRPFERAYGVAKGRVRPPAPGRDGLANAREP
jgi:hypothetical protein